MPGLMGPTPVGHVTSVASVGPMSTDRQNTPTPSIPSGQDLGPRWATRKADHADPGDRRAIRVLSELAFGSSAEADLVEELAGGGEGWLPQYSHVVMIGAVPGTDLHSDPEGHGLLVRAHVDTDPVLALAPHAVLPEHQGQGAGTAIVESLLQAARADGEKVVVVYGWPEYYSRFGFRPAAEAGITASFATQPEALQVLVLQEGADAPSGEFRYPPAFGSDNAQVAGRA